MTQMFLLSALVAMFGFSSIASAQIYKCKDADGRNAYQDTPCMQPVRTTQAVRNDSTKNAETHKRVPQQRLVDNRDTVPDGELFPSLLSTPVSTDPLEIAPVAVALGQLGDRENSRLLRRFIERAFLQKLTMNHPIVSAKTVRQAIQIEANSSAPIEDLRKGVLLSALSAKVELSSDNLKEALLSYEKFSNYKKQSNGVWRYEPWGDSALSYFVLFTVKNNSGISIEAFNAYPELRLLQEREPVRLECFMPFSSASPGLLPGVSISVLCKTLSGVSLDRLIKVVDGVVSSKAAINFNATGISFKHPTAKIDISSSTDNLGIWSNDNKAVGAIVEATTTLIRQHGSDSTNGSVFRLREDVERWFAYYYLKPEPNRVPDAILFMSKVGDLRRGDQSGLVGFLAGVFRSNPGKISDLLNRLGPLNDSDVELIVIGLCLSGLPNATNHVGSVLNKRVKYRNNLFGSTSNTMDDETLGLEYRRRFVDKDFGVLEELQIDKTPPTLWWGLFTSTGDEKYLLNIISALQWIHEDVEKRTGRSAIDRSGVAFSSGVLLLQVTPHHPRVLNFLEGQISHQSKSTAEQLRRIVNAAKKQH